MMTQAIAEFMATDEGKTWFRDQYNTVYEKEWKGHNGNAAYERSNARANALKDLTVYVTGEQWPGDYDVLQDNFTARVFAGKDVNRIKSKLDKLLR